MLVEERRLEGAEVDGCAQYISENKGEVIG